MTPRLRPPHPSYFSAALSLLLPLLLLLLSAGCSGSGSASVLMLTVTRLDDDALNGTLRHALETANSQPSSSIPSIQLRVCLPAPPASSPTGPATLHLLQPLPTVLRPLRLSGAVLHGADCQPPAAATPALRLRLSGESLPSSNAPPPALDLAPTAAGSRAPIPSIPSPIPIPIPKHTYAFPSL